MRIVFLGSGRFAIPSLEALLSCHEVVAVVTQPDREKGRGRGLAPPPVKPIAQAHGIPLLQPTRIKRPEAHEALRSLRPELQVVVAYGQILPRSVIDIPPRGTINVHASLLPRYRGAAPIQWAIVRGEQETGVTTMLIDEGLDTGPLLLSRSLTIGAEETSGELEPRLARLGAAVLIETLEALVAAKLVPTPQDHSRASLAPLIRKEDGRLDWNQPAAAVARRVRGFHPWPGTTTTLRGRALKLLRVRVEPGQGGDPGEVVALEHDGIVVACAGGTRIRILEVQPESRRPMPAAAYVAGARLVPGSSFD